MGDVDNIRTLKSRVQPISSGTPCLLGVSVARSEVDIRALCAAWAWTRERFSTCAILIGDSLVGLTLQAGAGLLSEAATREADRLASKLVSQMSEAGIDAARMIRTSDVIARLRFVDWRNSLFDTYLTAAPFRNSVDEDAASYCRRQEKKGALAVPITDAISISVEYLLDELAIYAVLAEDGWLAETYLGSELGTLARLIRGTLPGVAPILERRTHLSLKAHNVRRAA
jgi:tRNA-dependent cyclodipeptide synthase